MPFRFAAEARGEEIHERTDFGCEMPRMRIDRVDVERLGLEGLQNGAQASRPEVVGNDERRRSCDTKTSARGGHTGLRTRKSQAPVHADLARMLAETEFPQRRIARVEIDDHIT